MIIETSRLILRPLQLTDCDALVREFANYNIVRNTARIPFPYQLSDAEEYVQFATTLNARSKSAAITLKSDKKLLIGAISYLYSAEKDDAELGYWLSENYWGNGIMSETVYAMIEHAFTAAHITKMVACYHNDNPASGRILSKFGFVETARCSNYSKAQGKEVPVTNMALNKK